MKQTRASGKYEGSNEGSETTGVWRVSPKEGMSLRRTQYGIYTARSMLSWSSCNFS
jgi:hypothetical protein